MFEFDIRGGRKQQREVVDEVLFWCMKRLMPRVRRITIEVELTDIEPGHYGFCYEQDKKHYMMEIDKNLSLYDLIGTVCHEMVHVWQYHSGRLRECGRTGNWLWRESNWSESMVLCDGMKHHDLPHEAEAHDMDEKLAQEFFPHMKLRL